MDECGQKSPAPDERHETEAEKITRVTLEARAFNELEAQRRREAEERARQELEAQRRREAEERARKAALEEAAREADPATCDLQRVEVIVDDESERPCGDRVRYALLLGFLGLSEHLGNGRDGCGDRYSAPCVICEGPFVFAEGGRDRSRAIYARCQAGCDSEALARALEVFTVDTEQRLAREADEREREASEQEMSLSAMFADGDEQPWIVPGVIPGDGLTLLVGRPGAGKTLCAMHLSVCVAAGKPWLGLQTEQVRVLLVLLEGAKADRVSRIGKLIRGLDLTVADLERRLDIWQLPLKTDDPQSFRELARRIEQSQHKMIVIDNLSTARSGGSENDPGVMTAAMQPLAQLAQERGIGVVLLHHAGKDGSTRGTTAILGHTDMEIQVGRQNGRKDSRVTLTKGKSRYVDAFEDEIVLRFIGSPDGQSVVGELVELERDADERDANDKPSGDDGARRQGMLALLTGEGLTSEQLYAAMKSAHRCGRTATKRARDELQSEGAIAQLDGVWQRSSSSPPAQSNSGAL